MNEANRGLGLLNTLLGKAATTETNTGQEDARPDQDWLKIVSILVPGISFSSVMDK